MTNEQIYQFLLQIHPTEHPFKVVMTGKKSKKVNGLYKPQTQEILIHNKNFLKDEELLRTAIHEYAHHLHYHSNTPPKPHRPHDQNFWVIFHNLLTQSEKKGLYVDVFRTDPEFRELTQTIKTQFLTPHSQLIKRMGELLIKADHLCRSRSLSFRDYLERELGIKRPTAQIAMVFAHEDFSPELNHDQIKTITKVPPVERQKAVSLLLNGASEAQVLSQLATKTPPPVATRNPVKIEILIKKKQHLEQKIAQYQSEIKKIEAEIQQLRENTYG